MMRGKSVLGKMAVGSCQAAKIPARHNSSTSTMIARECCDIVRARSIYLFLFFLVVFLFVLGDLYFGAVGQRIISFGNYGFAAFQALEDLHFISLQIGRASCRERVEISGVAVSLKK